MNASRRAKRLAGLALFLMLAATNPVAADDFDVQLASTRIAAALQRGDREQATELADSLIKQSPADVAALQTVADTYLRVGRVERAAELYDRYAKLRPAAVPYLWQRGIALALSGRFDDAAKQFETHRRVNPNDVENATWHYLCVAKSKSPTAARQLLLPAPGDGREPMKQVMTLFSSGDEQPVLDRIATLPEGSDAHQSACFYGYLYLGMFADAQGDESTAIERLRQAVKFAGRGYMPDVTRIYAEILTRQSQRKKEKPGG